MADSTIYCEFERDRFPASAFATDAKGRRIHHTTPMHTIEGLLVQQAGVHEPPAAPRPEIDK